MDDLLWYQSSVEMHCPKCGTHMENYRSEKEYVYFQCKNENCKCRIVLEGEFVDDESKYK